MEYLCRITAILVVLLCITAPSELAERQEDLQERLRTLVRNEVLSRSTDYIAENVSVNILYQPGELAKVRPSDNISIKIPEQIRDIRGKLVVPVYTGDRKHNVIVNVHILGKVSVSKNTIKKYEIISDTAVEEKLMDLSSIPDSYVPDMRDIIGGEAAVNITPGTVILKRMVGRPTAGRKGERVNLVAKVNNVTVKCTGTLLQDAVQGTVVWVENEKSGTRVQGTLVSQDTVIVSD